MYNFSVYSRDSSGWRWSEKAEIVKEICKEVTAKLNDGLSIKGARMLFEIELKERLRLDENDYKEKWSVDLWNRGRNLVIEYNSWHSQDYIRGIIFWDDRKERLEKFLGDAERFIEGFDIFSITTDLKLNHPFYLLIKSFKEILNIGPNCEISLESLLILLDAIRSGITKYEFKNEVHTENNLDPFGVDNENWGWNIRDNSMEIWLTSIIPFVANL